MSSEISISKARLKPDPAAGGGEPGSARLQSDVGHQSGDTFQPWQFFVLAALGCATAVVFIVRGQGILVVLMLTVLMSATTLVGLAALRTLRPLAGNEEDRTPMIGHRTRAALEREKMLALRAIKELEFDRAMGKLSESDWHEMSGRLRARAAGLMRQLDAAAGYREQIERDLAVRLGAMSGARLKPRATAEEIERSESGQPSETADAIEHSARLQPSDGARPICPSCSIANDLDARFCKNCGARL
jgi:hypothetical protein